MTLRLLPPLAIEAPEPPTPRCKHLETGFESLTSENKGGGPRVECHVLTCLYCRWWIASKRVGRPS